MNETGNKMYQWASDVFPLCRSITGLGTRRMLEYFQRLLPDLKLHEIATGTRALDWTVPDEWNITDAFVADSEGRRIIDFRRTNLHVVGYSEPVDRKMSFDELDQHLYSLPDQPDAIPYVTSYYQRRWGFCLSESQRRELRANPSAVYHVKIDATLAPGQMSYGELTIPGESEKEVLLSTYVCHPSMANNELSGPCVAAALSLWLQSLPNRHFTYRVLFMAETIGSIVHLSRHIEAMKRNTVAGFVLTCLGDDRCYSYVPSRLGNTLADRAAIHALASHAPGYHSYSFLDRGSDERQYCSPGVDLPVCSVMRSKYGTYPEYHTSLDDLSFISPEGLQGGFDVLRKCIEWLEQNPIYQNVVLCEPQLSERGLYPDLGTKESKKQVKPIVDFLAYADGTRDLAAIAEIIGAEPETMLSIAQRLLNHQLIKRL